jgi:hypothetical protein
VAVEDAPPIDDVTFVEVTTALRLRVDVVDEDRR